MLMQHENDNLARRPACQAGAPGSRSPRHQHECLYFQNVGRCSEASRAIGAAALPSGDLAWRSSPPRNRLRPGPRALDAQDDETRCARGSSLIRDAASRCKCPDICACRGLHPRSRRVCELEHPFGDWALTVGPLCPCLVRFHPRRDQPPGLRPASLSLPVVLIRVFAY